MLLAKSRIPLISIAIILSMGLAFFLIAEYAAADGPTVPFDNNPGDNNLVDWDWEVSGQNIKLDLILDGTLAGDVFEIEFYVQPTTGTAATHTQRMGDFSAFPTEQVLSLNFSTSAQLDGSEPVGIHLHGSDGSQVLESDAPAALPAPTATPVPPAAPTATPVTTVEVPAGSITEVAAPSGGVAAVIQPSSAATISAPDGAIVVQVPPIAHNITFQIVYDPSPSAVPSTPANMSVIRAFGLNAHDADGVAISLQLLKSVTIVASYSAADAAAAPNGSPSNLKIARYDVSTGAWSTLSTTVDLGAMTLTAKSGHLSLFAVVGVEPAAQAVGTVTPTATAAPPPTGDLAPGSGLLLGMILVGFLLIAAGSTYMAQSRRAGH